MKCLLSAKPRPLRRPPLNLAITQFNGVESGLPELHAHTEYTVEVLLCVGVGLDPNLQIGAVFVNAEAIQAL